MAITRTFKTRVEIQNGLEPLVSQAVENACDRLLEKLQELIESEYYDQYTPKQYERKRQFYRSAMTKMLSKTSGQIFMNEDAMDYGQFWSGELQLLYASQGFHGSEYIQTEGAFWNSFIEYCDENAVNILIEELKKQGLKISK